MGRPPQHDEETRRALLNAAERLLTEQGPAALNLRGLARETGTSTRAVYSLFGSKEGLVRVLYLEGFAELTRRVRAPGQDRAPGVDHRAVLFAIIEAYRNFALEDPTLYRLMCERLVPEFEPTVEDRRDAAGALLSLCVALGACVEAGDLVGEPAGLTMQWWALIHGLATLEIRGFLGPTEQADRHWTAALRALYQGYAH
jgi:AcrR family transcriptional regulator